MTEIDKHIFIKFFAPTEIEGKRKVLFKNGSSIKTVYKSKFKFWVKYLPGNYADYYAPNFIIKIEKDLKIIPIPNFSTFLFIPLALIIMSFYEELKTDIIWTIVIALILFVILVQSILIYPSIKNIKKRVNERK